MGTFWLVLSWVLFAFMLLLIGRFILDWLQVIAREFRPRGPVLVIAEIIYSITDPPLKLLRKVVPSPRIGGIQLDLSFLVLFVAVSFALNFVQHAAVSA